MSNKQKTPEQIAALVCGSGECFATYDCGHSNKAPAAAHLFLIGTGTVCPLAKYNVVPDTRPWYECMGEPQLTLEDCWQFCAQCEHGEVLEDGTIRLKDFDAICLDCPVKSAMDAISEAEAEGRMS